MALLTGGAALRNELEPPEFSDAQLAVLAQGRLPEGVSPEQVARAVLALGVAGAKE
jgi:hypothetical protein